MKQKHVLVTNTTDKDQTVLLVPTNQAIIISPGAGAIIDTYNKKHSYLYTSYARKGMKVTKVDDSYFDNAILDEADQKLINETESKLPEITPENASEEKIAEAVAVTEEVATEETPVVEDKPKRKKSSKKVSESSEEVSATTESGE